MKALKTCSKIFKSITNSEGQQGHNVFYQLQSLDVAPADSRIKCIVVIKSGGDKHTDDLF